MLRMVAEFRFAKLAVVLRKIYCNIAPEPCFAWFRGCPISMSHCRARQFVIAALDAAISCIVTK